MSRATITLRIAGRASSQQDFESLIAPSLTEINKALGDLVYGSGSENLQDIVTRELAARELSFSCIELGCASWVGDWMLGQQDNASATEFTSHAFPNLDMANRWLGEETDHCDSLESLTKAYAGQLKSRLGTDVVLLIAHYPSPTEMAQAKGPFDQFFGVAMGKQVYCKETRMGGHPDVLGPRIAKTGLDFLRRILLGLPTN